MVVSLAGDRMPVEGGHVYVIPPGAYLSMSEGALRLSRPDGKHGARLPFDHLLRSMARDCGRRAACVVMSGGAVPTAVSAWRRSRPRAASSSFRIPTKPAYDGMPRSAIATGVADIVLPVAAMPAALVGYGRWLALAPSKGPQADMSLQGHLGEVTELLRQATARDFSLYKPGTVGPSARAPHGPSSASRAETFPDISTFSAEDAKEVELLAKDLLIHVTSFFRDPRSLRAVGDLDHPGADFVTCHWIGPCACGYRVAAPARRPIRWPCSSASRSRSPAAGRSCRSSPQTSMRTRSPWRVPASTRISPWPAWSPARLARFFAKEGDGYRVSSDLRNCVVFTVHDVLADPPFSRVDFVSCRNLLIYLGSEAQKKVMSLFHFAIREGGILLLGPAETVGKPDGRFEVVAGKERVYRQAGGKRFADVVLSSRGKESGRPDAATLPVPRRKATFSELCRDVLMETYAPAGVLVDRGNACLFFFGTADEYLQAPRGRRRAGRPRDGARRCAREAPVRDQTRARRGHTRRRERRPPRQEWRGRVRFPSRSSWYPAGEDGMLIVCFLDQDRDTSAQAKPTAEGRRNRRAREGAGGVEERA